MFTTALQLMPALLNRLALIPIACFATIAGHAVADEGMWQPHQLPDLSEQLLRLGLEINPEKSTTRSERTVATSRARDQS